MRVFGGERLKGLMGTFRIPEDQPIENRMISKQIESAQSRIEGFHFDAPERLVLALLLGLIGCGLSWREALGS